MPDCVLLAPATAITATVTLASDVLGATAGWAGPDADRVVVASADGQPARGGDGRPMAVDAAVDDLPAADVVWIGSSWGDPARLLEENAAAIPFLRRSHERGATIAAVGDAPFLLAEAGILDGRPATVFPPLGEELRRRYPAVDVQEQRHVVLAGTACTASGLAAACDLLVRLVEQRVGRAAAERAADVLFVDLRRSYDAGRCAFDAQREHGDALVARIQRWLEEHYAEPIELGEVADRFAVSPRTLTRRFRAATGELPSAYLQRLRVEMARDLLRRTSLSVRDVMLRVGYRDRGAFLDAFRRHLGHLPGQERRAAR